MKPDWFELKLPPPLLAVLLGAGMWALAEASGGRVAPGPWRLGACIVLALCALALDLPSLWLFLRRHTTINPMRPANTRALVCRGPYRLTRNPMYLGLLLALCAWALWLGTTWPWLAPPLFVAWITRFQIVPEERLLAVRFGADYARYRQRVRRWL